MVAYLPGAERVEIIRSYAQRFGIRSFIESGTSDGFTTDLLKDDFDRMITIELDPDLWARAVERFRPWPHITCLQGDSGLVLTQVVPQLEIPVIFWLDGHWSGGPVRGEIDTPIVSELETAVHAPQGSVIIIDDARLFGGMPEHTEEFKDYPDISWVRETGANHGFSFTLMDDIMRLVPFE